MHLAVIPFALINNNNIFVCLQVIITLDEKNSTGHRYRDIFVFFTEKEIQFKKKQTMMSWLCVGH